MTTNMITRSTLPAVTPAAIRATALRAAYDNQVALHGIAIDVPAGSCTAILGSNGAGKTTLMNAIAGIHRPVGGEILLDGERTERLRGHQIAARGVCYIPEGRGVFPDLSVGENLRLSIGRSPDVRARLYAQLPTLATFGHRQAGSLSGGEQQMLAMAAAVVGGYRLLMVDELSLGLAPMVVDKLFDVLGDIRQTGVTILLVEQFAERALALADHAYVLRKGRIVFDGPAGELRGDEATLHRLYLGSESDDDESDSSSKVSQ